MNPDTGDLLKGSTISKVTLLTLLFTIGYFYKSKETAPVLKLSLSKKDTVIAVTVTEPAVVKKKKKTIYLTFDDGPNRGTKNVLDIINKEEIPVTLFVVGEHVYGSKMQSAVYDSLLSSRFIEIANHSYTHAFHNNYAKYYSMPDSVVKDFKRCTDSLRLTNAIIRTPGRNIWRVNDIRHTDISSSTDAADSLQKKGYKVVGWDLEWFFNELQEPVQSSEEMAKQVDSMFRTNKNKTSGHLVLLAHDQVYKNSKDSAMLHQLISTLKAKGEYDFAMVKHYPALYRSSSTDSVYSKK